MLTYIIYILLLLHLTVFIYMYTHSPFHLSDETKLEAKEMMRQEAKWTKKNSPVFHCMNKKNPQYNYTIGAGQRQ